MSIIGKVGRKSIKVRLLNGIIHLVLLLGALTMIYPFMVMISASFKSNVDAQQFSVFPQFFFNEDMLYKKYIEARMNEMGDRLGEQYKNRALSFTLLEKPEVRRKQVYKDWMEYLKEKGDQHDIFDYYISEQFGRGIYPRNERKFRSYMKKKSGNSLQKLNEIYGTSTLNWDEVRLEEKGISGRNFNGDYSGFLKEYEQFREELPLWQRDYISLDGNFINSELKVEFRNDLNALRSALNKSYNNWEEIKLSREVPDDALKPYWTNYVKYRCNIQHVKLKPEGLAAWRDFLIEKYETIGLLNKTWKTEYESFTGLPLPEKLPRSGAQPVDYTFFIETIAEPDWLEISSVELDYRDWLADKYKDIEELNRSWKLGYEKFSEVKLPLTQPQYNSAKAWDWNNFVVMEADPHAIMLQPLSQQQFLEYMRTLHPDAEGKLDIEKFNNTYGTDFEDEISIYPSRSMPENVNYQKDWQHFVQYEADVRFLEVSASEEVRWQSYLINKYNIISIVNEIWDLTYDNFAEVAVDHYQIDYSIFNEHKTNIFWEFAKRNYVMVLDEMLYNGRAIMNTIIYCLLAIISALIVNPLAAYAMSRYKLPATYKIILVLMLTMAFPAMVMGIPNFLIMKKLGMLNTFWALILPGLADGYFIFLLKGFFDSLPKELFESATLDGASEWTIFWRIAMSLSKPIMAVIALNAFNAAYRNFMFAFIVCQDKSMWTMMVNIYQMMQRSSAGVGFAALVIASIPTFAVFVFFQNIIIRGIVVPTEK